MTTDANGLLMGTGGRSAKFEKEGAVVVGLVMRMETRQRTEIGSGKPLTWPDGNPQMQLVVTLETETREDDDDDGLRNLYIAIPSAMQKAVADAIRRSGERGLANGGKLGVKFTKTDAPKQRGFNGQKQYTAKYEPPVYGVDEDGPPEDANDLPF